MNFMNVNIQKTLAEIQQKLLPVKGLSLKELHSAYSLVTKLRSQLIGVIYEREFGNGNEHDCPKLSALCAKGEVVDNTVTLTIDEPLPPLKELTAAMQDHWLELIHTAIQKAELGQRLPYLEKAFVLIEIITPKYSDNAKLWDTSNRAVNLIINNLKGIFFEDDNHEHMAFGVIGKWGDDGKTVVRVMPLDRLECMSN